MLHSSPAGKLVIARW